MGRVFINDLGDRGSIPGRVIPKIQKIVLDSFLLNTQNYKVCIKGKVEQSWERNNILRYTLVVFTQPLRSGRIWHKVNF